MALLEGKFQPYSGCLHTLSTSSRTTGPPFGLLLHRPGSGQRGAGADLCLFIDRDTDLYL